MFVCKVLSFAPKPQSRNPFNNPLHCLYRYFDPMVPMKVCIIFHQFNKPNNYISRNTTAHLAATPPHQPKYWTPLIWRIAFVSIKWTGVPIVSVWRKKKNKKKKTRSHSSFVGQLYILAVALANSVYLWDSITSKVTTLASLEYAVPSVSWTQRGNHLAIGSNDGTVELWDISKAKRIRSLRSHASFVGSLSWSDRIFIERAL